MELSDKDLADLVDALVFGSSATRAGTDVHRRQAVLQGRLEAERKRREERGRKAGELARSLWGRRRVWSACAAGVGRLGMAEDLPAVGGERMSWTLAEFDRACRVQLRHEQEKVAPDTPLVYLLCEAVRLGRENLALLREAKIEP